MLYLISGEFIENNKSIYCPNFGIALYTIGNHFRLTSKEVIVLKAKKRVLLILFIMFLFGAAAANAIITNIILSSPENNDWTNDNTPDFNFAAASNMNSSFSCELVVDGNGYGRDSVSNNTSAIITANSSMSNGARNWNINCTDANGTVPSASRILNIDTVPPSVSSLNLPADNSSLANPNVVFDFTSSDNLDTTLNYTLYLNGAANATGLTAGNNTSTQFTLPLADGQYNWTIEVEDEAGNSANFSGVYNFTLDTEAPNVTDTSPNGTVAKNSITLKATTNENAVCRYSTNDVAYANMTSNLTGAGITHTDVLKLSNGNYIYYVRCSDSYENVMASSANITFTVRVSGGGGGGRHSSRDTSTVEEEQSNIVEVELTGNTSKATLSINDTGKFIFKNEEHEIKVTKINGNKASFTLQSKTQGFVLTEGETKKFDIDSNSTNYDLAVTLESIEGNSVNVILEKLDEIICTAVIEPEGAKEPDANEALIQELPAQHQITGAAIAQAGQPNRKLLFLPVMIVIALIIGLFVNYYWKEY